MVINVVGTALSCLSLSSKYIYAGAMLNTPTSMESARSRYTVFFK